MEKMIAKLNVEHFRRLLADEKDPFKRAQLQRLLAEEEAKLQALSSQPDRPRGKGQSGDS